MKRSAIIILTLLLALSAGAQDFRLGFSTGLSRVGYINKEGKEGSFYWDLTTTPDFRFADHWGALAEVSIGNAIAGSGEADGLHTMQMRVLLAPYYEQTFDKWYLDVLAGLSARARQPFYGLTPMRFGGTICLGPAAGVRSGYFINENVDIFGMLRFERNTYDPLASASGAVTADYRAGSIILAFGIRYALGK